MAFGQQAGPPASHRDVQRLLELLQEQGYDGFRDARGPMGLTQRQGGGRFTRDEAEALIEQLEAERDAREAGGVSVDGDLVEPPTLTVVPKPKLTAAEQTLRKLSTEAIAAELQRRGWIVIEP